MKMCELLADESRWCRHYIATTSAGVPVSPLSDIATKWCVLGALAKCYPDDGEEIHLKIREALSTTRHWGSLSGWNDQSEFPDIIALLRRLGV